MHEFRIKPIENQTVAAIDIPSEKAT